MAKPKRSSDEYIHLNKKITNKEDIKLLNYLAEEWNVTNKEVAYRLLCHALKKEKLRLVPAK